MKLLNSPLHFLTFFIILLSDKQIRLYSRINEKTSEKIHFENFKLYIGVWCCNFRNKKNQMQYFQLFFLQFFNTKNV